MFSLIQPLMHNRDHETQPPRTDTPGHDREFGDIFICEATGNVELLEIIPAALLELRSMPGGMGMCPIEITRRGLTRTVYIIGPDHQAGYQACCYENDHGNDVVVTNFQQALKAFRVWCGRLGTVAEDPTNFLLLFESELGAQILDDFPETVAWWSVDDNILWTLYEDVGSELLHAFSFPPDSP